MLSARSEVHFIALFHQTLFASFSFVAFLPGFCFAAHLFVFLRNAFCSSLRLDCCVRVAFYKKMKRAKKSPTNLLFFDAFCSFFAVVLFLLYCMFTFIIFTCSDRCNGSSLVLVGFFSRCFCRLRQPKDYKRLTGTAYKTENGYNNEQKWCRCDKVENKKLTTEKSGTRGKQTTALLHKTSMRNAVMMPSFVRKRRWMSNNKNAFTRTTENINFTPGHSTIYSTF